MFRRKRGAILADLSDQETGLLRRLITEYVELLDTRDDSAVMSRLYPDPSPTDEAVRNSFRELTQESLEEHKRTTAGTALESLGESGPLRRALSDDERDAWMVLFTDLRLVIGTRLGVDEEMMERRPDPNDPDQWPLALIHYLAYLQETLVEAAAE